MASKYDLKNIGRIFERVEKTFAWRRLQRRHAGQIAQNVVDNFFGRCARRAEAGGTELDYRIDFVKMPGKSRAQRHGAFKLLGGSFVTNA